MSYATRSWSRSNRWLGALISGVVLASCAAYSPSSEMMSEAQMAGDATADRASAPAPSVVDNTTSTSEIPEGTPSQPQLVKTAELVLTVESVTDSIEAAKTVMQQQQGDLLGLQDSTPTSDRSHHTASMQLRVPQTKLDTALQALKALGTLQRQAITADDVSDQLVDYEARLRNLRKTEATLLDIMERSGEIADVLKVAQELSNVRNSIEQAAAQLSTLQNQVDYSTINLNLQEAVADIPPPQSAALQLQETWTIATRSLSKFRVDLLQLGVWLLVYSPYWLVLAAIAFGVHTRIKSRPTAITPSEGDPPATV